MSRTTRRAGVAATAAACLLALTVPPAAASPVHPVHKAPSKKQIQAARDRVTELHSRIDFLQGKAEQATEAYNGALVASQKAAAASRAAVLVAQTAQTAALTARGAAVAAMAASKTADDQALAASLATVVAKAQTADAQLTVNRLVTSAYRSQGSLVMVSSLMNTQDPQALLQGRKAITSLGESRQSAVDELAAAQTEAQQAQTHAAQAQAAAAAAAQSAIALQDKEHAAYAQAATAATLASTALTETHAKLVLVANARHHAQAVVAQTELTLGGAVQSLAHLKAAAAAAQRAARSVSIGTSSSGAANTAIHWALAQIGTPYAWGGGDDDGPTRGFNQGANTVGFDCSGLTMFAYAHAGIQLDHYTGSQYYQGARVSSMSDLQPGDLMFFAYNTGDPSTIHHVTMYLGGGKMVEAPHTGDVVKISSAYRSGFIGATRPWA